MTVSLWAVMMVRDEIDVIEHTLRHINAQGVEGIIVGDNGSVDGTLERLHALESELDCKLIVTEDTETGYYQSRKTSLMARTAWDLGAEFVWPVDADEIGFHDKGIPLADVLANRDGNVFPLDLFNHYTTGVDSLDEENPFRRMNYRMADPQPLPKVIVRWEEGCVIHAGNHGADHPWKLVEPIEGLRIAHCPYRSESQFIRKAVNGAEAYEATNLPWSTGQHWREMGVWHERGGDEVLAEIYRVHFTYPLPSAAGLVYDPIPLKP